MSFFVTLLFVVTALFLIGVVLIQQPKTAGGLFSGTGQSLRHQRKILLDQIHDDFGAGFFMVLCLLMAALPRFQQPKSLVQDGHHRKAATTSGTGARPGGSERLLQIGSRPSQAPG